MSALKSTIVRDFGGGLNVVDDDLNLSASYQPVLDNVHRGVDNTLSVRWGTELFADLRRGTVTTGTVAFAVTWTMGSRFLLCDYLAHGLEHGDHITFTSGWGDMTGLNSSEIINVPLGVYVHNADSFQVVMKHPATVSGFDGGSKSITKDTHFLAGDILEIIYYDDHLIIFDSAGEVVKINAAMQIVRIWDTSKAYVAPGATEGQPGWSAPIDYVSTAIFKGKLFAVNGVDIPLLIDLTATPNVVYLGDPGNDFSTVLVPICKYICALDRWLIMAGDPLKPYKIHVSAQDAPGVWEDENNGDASDATSLEMNNTNSASIFIRGINKFRNFLAVAFDDTVAMVELGIYDGNVHNLEVSDSVARHGAVAHKSMVFLGFDLIMADAIGVPSFKKSQFDNSIIPSRLSEFIAPMMQNNINRLSTKTLERDLFSVYSTHDNRYILFVPNHDEVAMNLPHDPIYCLAALLGTDRVLLNIPNHGLEEGDKFTLTSITQPDPPLSIPNPCIVDTVVNKDVITFRLNSIFVVSGNFGGESIKITKLKTETTAYAFTYNQGLKIKAWSRYKGWNFRAGTTSLYGRVFLADKSRIWRMGNRFDPIYADFKGLFDADWDNNISYTAGQKIRDLNTREIFTCLVPHTSPAFGSFITYREANPDSWEVYHGVPIKFDIEFPWADFDKRDLTKILKTMNIDAKGTDRFNVQMYLDYYYKNKITGDRTPQLQMEMVGGDKGTYGVYRQTYGAGRIAIRQRPWPFEARGKLFKLRIHGATTEALRFIAFIFGYKIVGRDR